MKCKIRILIKMAMTLFFIFSFSCANLKNEAKEEVPLLVQGEVVRLAELPDKIDGFGTLSYQKKIEVTAVQDALLSKLLYREGDHIRKGTILAVFDNPQIMLALGRAENTLSRAEASLSLAKAQLMESEFAAEAQLISLEKSEAEMEQAWKAYYEEERKFQAQEILFDAGGVNEETMRVTRFQLESQRTGLQLAEKDLQIRRIGFRDQDLIAAGIPVPEEKEERVKAIVQLSTLKTHAELAAAFSSKEAAEKELKSAEIAKNDLVLYAPISGVIAGRYFEEGEHIKREDKVLTIIEPTPSIRRSLFRNSYSQKSRSK
ncbi:hypothetical protein FACS189494_08350 [Spirochaetia bacterium]|nr:hypothetical protein FACS189494_08350 [Spirochaetia bacterium]